MLKFVLLCVVLFHDLSISQSKDTQLRVKQQDEPEEKWSWGNADAILSDKSSDVIIRGQADTTTERNPCKVPAPGVPNFRKPGRRISQVKCMEYIWDIKEREDKVKRDLECSNYLYEKGIESDDAVFSAAGVGGRNTLPGEFPHMAAIGWRSAFGEWAFKCGGSLISNKFVLTAAHCSKASNRDTTIADVDPKIVRLADKNILEIDKNGFNKAHLDVDILRVINHPSYKAPTKYNDIAIMELAKEVKFTSFIQPACLNTGPKDALVGQKSTMTGWGVVETVNRTTSPELQAVLLDVLDTKLCDNLLKPSCNRNWCGIKDHQICAGKLEGGADACQGDSGGPLQIEITLPQPNQYCEATNSCRRMHQLIGVTSFGIGCALKNLPGIYTSVSSYLDWIEPIVWK